MTDQPITDQPITEQPALEQPALEQPALEQPTPGLATQWLVLTCDDGSVDLAEQELKRSAPQSAVAAHLAPGVLLVDAGQPWADLAAAWRAAPPIFVRHICPVHALVPLWESEGDLDDLAAVVVEGDLRAALPPETRFSVQTRLLADLPYKPFAVNDAVAAAVLATVSPDLPAPVLDVRQPDMVLSVVCTSLTDAVLDRLPRALQPPPHSAAQALLGLSPAADNLSDWAGGMRRFAREEGQVSRSEFKLLEALEVFHLDLPDHGVALDLGAAPGGWTRVLRRRGQYVTAIDPGLLDPRIAADSGVRHKHMTAEAYLRDEPDRFDLIVNDMRMDARDSARLMVSYAPLLYRHGQAIMTLKLPEAKRTAIIDLAFEILRGAYTVVAARQLFHNRSEITVCLRPNPRAAGSAQADRRRDR